jgi:protein-S-isoprenylcysteine O-methyltransferase Ste14
MVRKMNPEKIETIKAFFGTIGFLFVMLPLVLILIPFKILTSPNHVNLFELGTIRYFGMVPIAIGVIIYFSCSYAFVFSGRGTPIHSAPPKKLVVKGLYRYVRNPMYIAGFLVLVGETLLFQSKGLFIYFLIMFGIFNLFVMFAEEPGLRKRFGESYIRYCKSVGRWIPRLTPYQGEDTKSQ